jgi:hypothetical protein
MKGGIYLTVGSQHCKTGISFRYQLKLMMPYVLVSVVTYFDCECVINSCYRKPLVDYEPYLFGQVEEAEWLCV